MTRGPDSQTSDAASDEEPQSLEKTLSHLLEECRMVLPGIQAILGFQLIAVFNEGFGKQLSPAEQIAHLVSVGLMVLSVGSLLTPAAYHRIAETRTVSDKLVTISSTLLTLGMFFLMGGLSVDLYLISRIITHSGGTAAMVAVGAGAVLVAMWFIFPFSQRKKRGKS